MSEDFTLKQDLLWEQWDQVDALLGRALDLPAVERTGFIQRATPDDPALRTLLLRLVRRASTGDERVNAPPASVVAAAFETHRQSEAGQDLGPGTVVGRYVILGMRGRGGMATVYDAERNDGVYRQRVALKVLRRGLDTEDLIRRFVTERQILSSLNHPHIARLLDGGSTQDGRPYLVMELVDGEPITRFADQRRLPVPARLGLFLGVADAVHAAHKQLVVHRDIKPSNILVDRDEQVKLLDFGIAKLLESDAELTEAGARALTPEYATPEQLRGGPITTATDVYQLGLLLRELLTGVRLPRGDAQPGEPPLRAGRLATSAIDRMPDPEVRSAARATTPRALARRLQGDLDLIIDKALRPEPEQRYASADELAMEVRRHLQGLPILAHAESLGYRMRKFVRRNRVGAAALAGLVMLLVGYTLTLTVQSRRVVAERDRAALEARKAGQVTEFLVRLFQGADPNRGVDVTARELLDAGALQVEQESIEDPAIRAAMLSAMGRSYFQLGLYDEADLMLTRAVEARRAAHGLLHGAVAADLNELARVAVPTDRRRALDLFEEALGIAQRAVGPRDALVGRIMTNYSEVISGVEGGDGRAGEMSERAVEILRSAPGDVRAELANALVVSAYGKPPAIAIPRMREALDLRRAIFGERHTMVASSLSDLALATELMDPLAADSLLQSALEIVLAIHGERHVMTLGMMNNLAALRRDRGAYAESEPLYRKVLALRREIYPDHRRSHAYALYGLGVVLAETGQAPEGERLLREALAILEREAPGTALVSLTRAAIGHALARQQRFPEAERLLVPAYDEIHPSAMAPLEKARVLERLVRLYQDWDRGGDARSYQARLDSLVSAEQLTGFELSGR